MPYRRSRLAIAVIAASLVVATAPRALAEPPQLKPSATRPPASASADYVRKLYADVLGRAPDAAGLAAWTTALDHGAPRAQVAAAVVGSAESRTRRIQQLHQQLLGRAADPAATNLFVQQIANGASDDQVVAEIVGSQEYFQRAGGNNGAFVARVCHDLLNRDADSFAILFGAQLLANGTSRAQLAQLLLATDDYQRRTLADLYKRLLHRAPASADTTYMLAAMHQGAKLEQIIVMIVASDEYLHRA